eukprot:10482507-Karenia_brevis.AAC.1
MLTSLIEYKQLCARSSRVLRTPTLTQPTPRHPIQASCGSMSERRTLPRLRWLRHAIHGSMASSRK